MLKLGKWFGKREMAASSMDSFITMNENNIIIKCDKVYLNRGHMRVLNKI